MIAHAFAKNGISVSAALCFEGKTILKAGEAEIMLFEWVDDITLETNDVTTRHCRQIGELIGQMHNCRLTIENTPLPASLGARMEWMEFNMPRSMNRDAPPDERMLGAEHVTCTLADILSLARREREFLEWLNQP